MRSKTSDRAHPPANDHESTDGRLNRSAQTRERIAQAVLDLIDEGHLVPTGQQVAERAGVGHRTVFRHFQDMEALYRVINEQVHDLVLSLIDPPVTSDPLEDRLGALVQRRSRVFERTKMFRQATDLRLWTSPYLQRARATYGAQLKDALYVALPEVADQPAAMRPAIEALVAFETWDRLRTVQGLTITQARATLDASLRRLLGLTPEAPADETTS